MKRANRGLVLGTIPLLLASGLWAQGLPTGTVSGRVSDPEGLSLPGVSVSATSPNLQGTRAATTNVNGDYTLPALPPGDYTIAFSMPGFGNVSKAAEVGASQRVPMDVRMGLAAVVASSTVLAQTETVSQSSLGATTYGGELTRKLPTARTVFASVVLSPGVNTNGPSGSVTISGAQAFDNLVTLDGVTTGGSALLVIEDTIQETTTMTSGVSAEYGRFTGGVVNTITRSGGNSFSGSVRATLNNNDWQAQTPIAQAYVDETVPTYEATLGGPIWRDRIWFFGAGRYVKNEFTGQTAAPTNVTFPRETVDERFEGKLTVTPFASHTLTAAYTRGEVELKNTFFGSLPLLETNGTIYDAQAPTDLLSLNYNGVVSSGLFVEARYSLRTYADENFGSRYNELVAGTPVLVLDRGYGQMFGAVFCAVCPGADSRLETEDFGFKGTYFLSTRSLGSHTVAFGYDDFSYRLLSNNWQSGSSWLLYASSVRFDGTNLYPAIDENSYLLYAPIPQESQGSDLGTRSLFVNDTWRLGSRLSFNLGLRWDKNDATDAAGYRTADDSAVSPRLSASFDVKGDGKVRLTASYATYVGQLQESMAGSGATGAGRPSSYYYFWSGSPINTSQTGPWTPTAQVLSTMFSALGVTGLNQFPAVPADAATVPGVNLLIVDSLRSPKANEFVLGVGGTLGRNLVYRVDGVRREYEDFYATRRDTSTGTVTDSLGNEFDLGVLVNSNVPVRTYTGLHTSLAWRLGRLGVDANWTWSHAIGNFVGEAAGIGPTTAQFENYPEYFDDAWSNPSGDLSQDQRHRVRLLATYDLELGPVRISPGLVQAWDSGVAYSASGFVATQPFVTNPGYVTPPTRVPYFFSPRGAFRTDDVWRTDLSVTVGGRVGPVEVFVQPQVWNVFNGQAVVFPGTSVLVGTGATANAGTGLTRFDPFTTTPVECPQGSAAAQCKALGANWQKAATFGQATSPASYQMPRRWFVAVGARF